MRRLARRGRATRGFTLLELMATVAITGTVLALALPWVMSVVTSTTTNLDTAAGARAAATITRALNTDLTHALTCPATGTPFAQSDPTTFALYATIADDGTDASGAPVQLVVWHLAGTTLSRATTPATLTTASCGATDPAADPRTTADATWVPFAGVASADATDGSGGLRLFSDQGSLTSRLVSLSLTLDPADTTSAPVPVQLSHVMPAPAAPALS